MENDNIHSFFFSLFWLQIICRLCSKTKMDGLDRLDGNGHLIVQNPDPRKNQSVHRHLPKTGFAI